jgi:hypothetical protein
MFIRPSIRPHFGLDGGAIRHWHALQQRGTEATGIAIPQPSIEMARHTHRRLLKLLKMAVYSLDRCCNSGSCDVADGPICQ